MDDSQRIAILAEALGYYADHRVYKTHSVATPPVMLDKGKRATKALDKCGIPLADELADEPKVK